MTQTNSSPVTPLLSTEGVKERPIRSAPRRWWRAVDQLTLVTMNPIVPARAARASDRTDRVHSTS